MFENGSNYSGFVVPFYFMEVLIGLVQALVFMLLVSYLHRVDMQPIKILNTVNLRWTM